MGKLKKLSVLSSPRAYPLEKKIQKSIDADYAKRVKSRKFKESQKRSK